MKRSYVYTALGTEFLEEAEDSIKSLRSVDPVTPITLFTDCPNRLAGSIRKQVTRIEQLPHIVKSKQDKAGLFAKIDSILACPAEKIVFLDTDTIHVAAFDLWDVLNAFPLAFCYDPIRWDYEMPNLPEAFPTPNTGMLAVNRTEGVLKVMHRWKALFEEQMASGNPPLHDQPAFRQAVFESGLRFLVLPSEFNLRVTFNHMVAGNARVKMLHGRHGKLRASLEYANTVEFLPRVYGRTYSAGELVKMLWSRLTAKCGFQKNDRLRGAKDKN